MKRPSIAIAAAFAVVLAASPQLAAQTPPAFGSPPSGLVPILFNDAHVYARPDALRAGRVLAALVRGKTILVPLRSMFEQMGASVAYDPASRTAVVSKPGSEVRVTVGRPEVMINGETRPLDVPPEIYRGAIVVPVRVISEAMGAYVQWVPDKRVVVVRYVQAPVPPPPPPAPAPPQATPRPTPVPTAAPTAPPPAPPTPPPTPTPAPTKAPSTTEHFIVGDFIISPKTYNEFDPGTTYAGSSYSGRAAAEIPLADIPLMVEVDARQYAFSAPAGEAVTAIGAAGQYVLPGSFVGENRDLDARLGIKVLDPRIYVGIGYLWRTTSYGYPREGGIGFGVEKLPDADQRFSVYGSAWVFPNVRSTLYTDPTTGSGYVLSYEILKYTVGVTWNFLSSNGGVGPLFLDASLQGEHGTARLGAPGGYNQYGPAVGLGVRF